MAAVAATGAAIGVRPTTPEVQAPASNLMLKPLVVQTVLVVEAPTMKVDQRETTVIILTALIGVAAVAG